MASHEIYARCLLSGKGFAPWRPCPINLAEVGYMLHGKWILLFDASKERRHKSNRLGVPKGYKPLVIGEVDKGTLCGGLPITSERGTTQKFGTNPPGSMCVSCLCLVPFLDHLL
jgi:hypothetical protein